MKCKDSNLVMLVVPIEITDAQLNGLIVNTTRMVLEAELPCWLIIPSFDDDPRELWEIPEVKTLCSRLVESGFISVLGILPTQSSQRGLLSGYTVWKMSLGEITDYGPYRITSEDMEEFYEVLMEANAKCDRLVEQSQPHKWN
jgi:hypothetical protein